MRSIAWRTGVTNLGSDYHRGVEVILALNWDRLLMVAGLGFALYMGAFIATI